MIFAENLLKVSKESLPSAVDAKYDQICEQLMGSAKKGVTKCWIEIPSDEAYLLGAIVDKLSKDGFQVGRDDYFETRLKVSWE